MDSESVLRQSEYDIETGGGQLKNCNPPNSSCLHDDNEKQNQQNETKQTKKYNKKDKSQPQDQDQNEETNSIHSSKLRNVLHYLSEQNYKFFSLLKQTLLLQKVWRKKANTPKSDVGDDDIASMGHHESPDKGQMDCGMAKRKTSK